MEGCMRTEGLSPTMTTADVAAAAGYSVQQVRDLEALGVIPPATRTRSGYRQFSPEHVHSLCAYRDLAYAVGPVVARRTMRQIRSAPSDYAAAMISELHTRLNREREHTLAARSALTSISSEETADVAPTEDDCMTITELAQALEVKASTLRFWESVGLITPQRVSTPAGSVRRYPGVAIRDARIVAALRAGGYRIPEVQKAISAVRELTDHTTSLTALDSRLQSIAQRTFALLRSGAILADLIEQPRSAGLFAAAPTTS